MRVLITGGRTYSDAAVMGHWLDQLPRSAVVVHGAASGADSLAATIWQRMGGEAEAHPAQWLAPCRASCREGHRRERSQGNTYCPMAGIYRNIEMLDSGVHLVIAFPGGRGTADMVRRSRSAGAVVWEVGDTELNYQDG